MSDNSIESRPSLGELIVELIAAVNRQHAFFDDESNDSDGRDEVRQIVEKIDDFYGPRAQAKASLRVVTQ